MLRFEFGSLTLTCELLRGAFPGEREALSVPTVEGGVLCSQSLGSRSPRCGPRRSGSSGQTEILQNAFDPCGVLDEELRVFVSREKDRRPVALLDLFGPEALPAMVSTNFTIAALSSSETPGGARPRAS